MFRFTRSVAVKLAVNMPSALQFSGDLMAHVKAVHGIQMKTGVEMFGNSRLHWFYDVQNLDELAQFNARLLQDRAYWELLEKYKHLWVEGSLRDMVVSVIG